MKTNAKKQWYFVEFALIAVAICIGNIWKLSLCIDMYKVFLCISDLVVGVSVLCISWNL